jgi:Flp pilus assembly protein CpaB
MKQKNLVLMVVAVGCGLVAAVLTSQMSAKPQIEKVNVLVAAKDLTVGTQFTKEELKTAVKMKEVPKDAINPATVLSEEELVDRRLTRPVRAEEMFNKGDVTKGQVVSIPPGMNMMSLPMSVPQAAAGFVGPGSRVDVLASFRLQNKIIALPVLVNMLVLAVDANTTLPDKNQAFQNLSTVSFAVDRKQALLIKLAQTRGCDLSLLLRNPEDKVNELDKNYDIDKVIKQLADSKNPVQMANDPENARKGAPSDDDAPAPVVTVKVPVALTDIPAGTPITNELIADQAKFGTKELPKDLAEDAITDLTPYVGQEFKTGLGKGQWVTKNLVASTAPKPGPKSDQADPKPDPEAEKAPRNRKYYDLGIHSPSGTRYFRYEEVAPGEWRLLGEIRPDQRQPESTKPAEGGTDRKVD